MTWPPEGPLEVLRETLVDVDVVSFDFFDTLVHRPALFAPTTLFHLVEREAGERGRPAHSFADVRRRAEGIARSRAASRGVGEVTLAEIYEEVSRLAQIDAEACAWLMDLEVDIERHALEPLPNGRALYDAATSAGKRIVIVSDTYFDVTFLAEIAERSGFAGYEAILASSEHGCTKASGRLFDRVLDATGVGPARIVHVGDDAYSDYRGALGRGLKAILVPTDLQSWRRARSVPTRTTGSCVLDELFLAVGATAGLEPGESPTLVPEVAGLFLGHALWLASKLQEAKTRTAYFFSRDGWIMKEFFDLVARASQLEVESRYLYVSRSALYPSVIFTAPEVARELFTHSWDYLPIMDACRRIGLDENDVREAFRLHGLQTHAVLGPASRKRFDDALVTLWPTVKERNSAQQRLVMRYLEQEGVLTSEAAAFVDIGWHGSMQNAILLLCRSLGIRTSVHGYYVGTFGRPTGADPAYRASGFLVEDDGPPEARSIVRSSPSLIELLHGADHGTVDRYEECSGCIRPVFDVTASEFTQHRAVVAPIQQRALALARSVLDAHGALRLSAPDPTMVVRAALGWIVDPTREVAEALGRLTIATDVRGVHRSITGAIEHPVGTQRHDMLPDGSRPLWLAGRKAMAPQPARSLRVRTGGGATQPTPGP